MTKPELIDIIKLLSALETWGFIAGQRIPEHLSTQIELSVELLTKEVLNDK